MNGVNHLRDRQWSSASLFRRLHLVLSIVGVRQRQSSCTIEHEVDGFPGVRRSASFYFERLGKKRGDQFVVAPFGVQSMRRTVKVQRLLAVAATERESKQRKQAGG